MGLREMLRGRKPPVTDLIDRTGWQPNKTLSLPEMAAGRATFDALNNGTLSNIPPELQGLVGRFVDGILCSSSGVKPLSPQEMKEAAEFLRSRGIDL